MELNEIDKNLNVPGRVQEKNLCWHSAQKPEFCPFGFDETGLSQGEYRRMPPKTAQSVSPGVAGLFRNTAGGRLRFCTDSDCVAIRVKVPGWCQMPHMPLTGSGGFALFVTENGKARRVGGFVPPWEPEARREGYEAILHFEERKPRDLTLAFPLYNDVSGLEIGLREGASLSKGGSYRLPQPVLYYGSSITQGACAGSPGYHYAGHISRMLDLDERNLGFSGSARGEQAMAEYIAAQPMCALVMEYDYNAESPEDLWQHHRAFYRTIRRLRPELPILCTSSFYPRPDGQTLARRAIVEETVKKARAEGDERIRFQSPAPLALQDGADCCTVDGVHPNDLGFYRIARLLAPPLAELLGLDAKNL